MSPLMEDELADMEQENGATSSNLTPMTLFLWQEQMNPFQTKRINVESQKYQGFVAPHLQEANVTAPEIIKTSVIIIEQVRFHIANDKQFRKSTTYY